MENTLNKQTYQDNVEEMPETVNLFIQKFIAKRAMNSFNTASSYETDIRQFFKMMKRKDIEMLTKEDLIIDNDIVENWVLDLKTNDNDLYNSGKPYSVSSIRRKVIAVRKLYGKLEAKGYNVKKSWFEIDKLSGSRKKHAVVEWKDVERMIEVVKTEVKGDIKATLIETAVVTAIRENALLNLTWDNLRREDNTWVLVTDEEAVEKGNEEFTNSIDDELYEKLMLLKDKYHTPYKKNGNRIFPIDVKTVRTMMKRLREELGLKDNVVFHSLKKTGIKEIFEISGGDITAIAKHAHHKSARTTLEHYMELNQKPSESLSLLIGKEIDLSPLKELSHEDLIKLIENSSRGLQFQLLNNLKSQK
jgi:integrase